MKKILLSLMIALILISPVWANKLDERQLKESYAKSADVYTKAEIDAMPSGGGNLTISVAAAETLAAGDVVSLIGTETITAKKTDNTNVVGICQNACDTDEVATVLLKGSDTNQSGLTIGENYYRQADYSIGTDAVLIDGKYILIGIAKSSIEIILN